MPPTGGPRGPGPLERLLEADLPDVALDERYAHLRAHALRLARASGLRPVTVARVIDALDGCDLGIYRTFRSGDLPVALADAPAPPCSQEVWRRSVEEFEATDAVTIRDALIGQGSLTDGMRRLVAFGCASAAMSLWLGAMPFAEANLWCAELHAFATLIQFDVELPDDGLHVRGRHNRDRYADVVRDRVCGRPDDAFAAQLGRLDLPPAVAEMARRPEVAPLVSAFYSLLGAYGWNPVAPRGAPTPPSSGI